MYGEIIYDCLSMKYTKPMKTNSFYIIFMTKSVAKSNAGTDKDGGLVVQRLVNTKP